MSLRLVLAIFGLAIASCYGERVSCREVRQNDGKVGFDCVTVVPVTDLAAQNLYILWLQSRGTKKQHSVDITVPNYKIDDVIQAAAKAGGDAVHTNINVDLERPVFSYIAQKQDGVGDLQQTFDVNLQYDRLEGRAVHFADDGQGSERYAPLRGDIQLPPIRPIGRQ